MRVCEEVQEMFDRTAICEYESENGLLLLTVRRNCTEHAKQFLLTVAL